MNDKKGKIRKAYLYEIEGCIYSYRADLVACDNRKKKSISLLRAGKEFFCFKSAT